MKKEKELLLKQLELLAEQSSGAVDRELAELSTAMCEVYRALIRDRLLTSFAVFSSVGFNLLICILVHIKKPFRRDP